MSDLVNKLRDIPNSDGVQFQAANRLEKLEKAVANLLKVRGRYHSELAYKELERVYHESPNSSN